MAKTESVVEFFVVREVTFTEPTVLVHQGGGKKGEAYLTVQPGEKVDVWFKQSVDKQLRALLENAVMMAARPAGEAILELTYDATQPPISMYGMKFRGWGQPSGPALTFTDPRPAGQQPTGMLSADEEPPF